MYSFEWNRHASRISYLKAACMTLVATLASMMMINVASAAERRIVFLEGLAETTGSDNSFTGRPHGQLTIVADPPTLNGSEGKIVLDVSNLFCVLSSNNRAHFYSLYIEIENPPFPLPFRHMLVFNTRCSGWGSYHGERFDGPDWLDAWLDPSNRIRVRIWRMGAGSDDGFDPVAPIVPDPTEEDPIICGSPSERDPCVILEGTD